MADEEGAQVMPDSPVIVSKPDITGGSGGSSEEEFVAVDKNTESPEDEDEEDEGEFMPRAELDSKPAAAAAAPRPSARAPDAKRVSGAGLQVTSFGAAPPPVGSSGDDNLRRTNTINVKEGYRARLLVGAAAARDKVKEVSDSDRKFNCVVVILVGSLTQLFASIQYAGKEATVFMDPEIGQVVREGSALGNYALWVGILSTLASLGYMTVCILYPERLASPSKELLGGRVVLDVQVRAAPATRLLPLASFGVLSASFGLLWCSTRLLPSASFGLLPLTPPLRRSTCRTWRRPSSFSGGASARASAPSSAPTSSRATASSAAGSPLPAPCASATPRF